MAIYPKPLLQQLIDDLNASNPELPMSLDSEAYSFGTPVALPIKVGAVENTRVRITPMRSTGYIGSVEVSYRRLNLEHLFRGVRLAVSLWTPTGRASVTELIDAINRKYGTFLIPDDFKAGEYAPGVLNLPALSNSLTCTGTITLSWSLDNPPPVEKLAFSTLFTGDTLNYTLPDVSLPGEAALLTEINRQYNTPLTQEQVSFGPPSARVSTDGYNSQVEVTASEDSGYAGSQVFKYNRFSQLALLGTGADTSPIPKIAGGTNTHAYLSVLNTRFNLALVPQDLVPRTVSSASTALLIEAAPTSYLYLPGTSISLPLV